MAKFTNIKNDDQKPLMVDVENVAVLIDCTNEHQKGLYLSDIRQGRTQSLNGESWGVDGDSIAENIRKAGIEFIKMPFYWGKEDYGHYYVNPAAVDVISVSKTFIKPDDGSEYVTLLAGTQRGDTVETSYVPLETATELVDAIKRVNPNMVEISSDMASTSFVQGGFTLLDTSQIISVHPNLTSELHVSFTSNSSVSLRVVEFDAINKDKNEYLNRLFNRLRGDRPVEDLIKDLGGDMNVLIPRLYRREELYAKRLVDKFAAAVLDNVDGLVKIDNTKGTYYARPDQISSFYIAGDTAIQVNFNKLAKEQYAPDLQIHYADGDDALKGMKNLVALTQKP
ncbi:MAG: hypothetical protein VYC19_12335 [Pseudomonadota bacterium]|jgi:hypothetical protein|nr:hypothetical protein [Pseudomonadota bacterium]MEC7703530.1 hypothetical protein [Pseudomonadota bacterium]